MASIDEEITVRIKAALEEENVSRHALASASGLAYNTLNRKLNGGGSFTVDELGRIAQKLNKTPADFLPRWFSAGAASAA